MVVSHYSCYLANRKAGWPSIITWFDEECHRVKQFAVEGHSWCWWLLDRQSVVSHGLVRTAPSIRRTARPQVICRLDSRCQHRPVTTAALVVVVQWAIRPSLCTHFRYCHCGPPMTFVPPPPARIRQSSGLRPPAVCFGCSRRPHLATWLCLHGLSLPSNARLTRGLTWLLKENIDLVASFLSSAYLVTRNGAVPSVFKSAFCNAASEVSSHGSDWREVVLADLEFVGNFKAAREGYLKAAWSMLRTMICRRTYKLSTGPTIRWRRPYLKFLPTCFWRWIRVTWRCL